MRSPAALLQTAIAIAVLGSVVQAQEPASRPARLAAGWGAVAAGQPAQAFTIAEKLLGERPDDHDAVSLAIAARVTTSAVGALDSYERWLAVRKHEDRYLLQPIAAAVLQELSSHAEPRIRYGALAFRAGSGDPEAQQMLNQAAAEPELPIEAERALALAGHPEGIARLEAKVAAPDTRDKSAAIDALRAAGARGSVQVVIAALQNQALPTKLAAANALGDFGGAAAIQALQTALNDPDPPVRVVSAAALARLGDPAGMEMIRKFEASPVGDLRLLAAQANAATGIDDTWVGPATGLLQDPDPMVRLNAAELLLKNGRNTEAAAAAIELALNDPSPGLRSLAAQRAPLVAATLTGSEDLATLRRMLRDALADIRLAAATGLLWPASRR